MSCHLSLGRLLTLNRARPTLNERARLLCMRWMAHQPRIIAREQEATAHARRDDEGSRIPGVLGPGDRLALAQEAVPSQDRERQHATGHGSCCAGQQICSQRRCVVHRVNARLLHALAPCHGVDGHDAAGSRRSVSLAIAAGERSPGALVGGNARKPRLHAYWRSGHMEFRRSMIKLNNGVVHVYTFRTYPNQRHASIPHPYTEPETAWPEFRLNLLKMT